MLIEVDAVGELEELTKKMAGLSPAQRGLIEQEVDNLLYNDTESDDEATALKHEVYSHYTDSIAELVAEVEVQAHDLPVWVYGCLELIFKFCAVAMTQDNQAAAVSYRFALKYEKFLISFLKLYLIESYRKDILHFRKTIKKFNHEPLQTEYGQPVLEVLNGQIECITASRQAAQKEFEKCYKGWTGVRKGKFNKIDIKAVDFDKLDDLDSTKLETCYEQVTECLRFCENTFPTVAGNGFVDSRVARFVSFLPDFFAFVLAVVGIVILLRNL